MCYTDNIVNEKSFNQNEEIPTRLPELWEVNRVSKKYNQFMGMNAINSLMGDLYEADEQLAYSEIGGTLDGEISIELLKNRQELLRNIYDQMENQEGAISNLSDVLDYQRDNNIISKSNWKPTNSGDIRKRFSQGSGWLECDWQRTADDNLIISHSGYLNKKLFKLGKRTKISDLTTAQLKEAGFSDIDDVFGVVSDYSTEKTKKDDKLAHGLVMEIKKGSLGDSPEQNKEMTDLLKSKMTEYNLKNKIVFSAINPDELLTLHENMYKDENFKSSVISNTDYMPGPKFIMNKLMQRWTNPQKIAAMQEEYLGNPEGTAGAVGMAVGFSFVWKYLSKLPGSKKRADRYLSFYVDKARDETDNTRLLFILSDKKVNKAESQMNAYTKAGGKKRDVKYIPAIVVPELSLKKVFEHRTEKNKELL